MSASAGDIDRLIEEGLTRYGKGELDAALEAWELALQIDPENPQASSYVDYVRLNYDLLVDGQAPTPGDDGAPFVGDDDDYQVEIVPGEIVPAAIVMPVYDAVDEGWALDDEEEPSMSRTISEDPPQITLELDAEPPPDNMSFDDTREYDNGRPPTRIAGDEVNEFAPQVTPGFGGPQDVATPPFGSPTDLQTPSGFAQQLTGVRKRDLGFVKPASPAAVTTTSKTIPGMTPITPHEPDRSKRASIVPELKMTLRTPEIPPHLEDAEITVDRGMRGNDLPDEPPTSPRLPLVMDDLARLDMISSMPMPTPARTVSSIERAIADAEPQISFEDGPELEPEPDPEKLFGANVPTRDLPASMMRDFAFELGAAGRIDERLPPPREPSTRPPTREMPSPERLPASASTPPLSMMSGPTRDLGIRPMRLPTEEESTGQLEIPRPPVVRQAGRAARPTQPPEVAPTDLIDTTAQLILEAVDRDTPVDESRDDRTRRRIQGLLERASHWVTSGEAAKAVAAIDLALAEDPTSPLAQKLVHRNQGAIQSIFQTYLGDLQRQPTLARPLSELATAPISPRAAFLLSRIDGMISLDEILDVSGMPRLEAYRYLCQLFLRGILK